jgi:hypothetical protein
MRSKTNSKDNGLSIKNSRKTHLGRPSQGKNTKRKLSPKQKKVYLYRRLFALLVFILVVVLVVAIAFAVKKSMTDSGSSASTAGSSSASSGATNASPSTEQNSSPSQTQSSDAPKTKDDGGVYGTCSESNVKITLTPTVMETKTDITFNEEIDHIGDVPCTIDTYGKNMALQVFSGEKLVYSSEACEADTHDILLGKDDKWSGSLGWGLNRSNNGTCSAERVSRGAYSAQLVLLSNTNVTSNSVKFQVL